MNPISPDVAKKFCELCNEAYKCWLTRRRLFDENNRQEKTIEKTEHFTEWLATITHEYVLLQICKLHDPAVQGSLINITINYILQFGDWGSDKEKIQGIVSRLNILFEKIKSARNKILVHNDLETLMDEKAILGEFPEGLDEEYFLALQELANEVHMKWFKVPYSFKVKVNKLVGDYVDEFLDCLEKA